MIIVLYHAHSLFALRRSSHDMTTIRLELLLMIVSLIELYSGHFSSHASGSEVIYYHLRPVGIFYASISVSIVSINLKMTCAYILS